MMVPFGLIALRESTGQNSSWFQNQGLTQFVWQKIPRRSLALYRPLPH